MSAFTTYRRSDTPTPPPPESSRALEEVIRTALKDENWTKNAQKAEETFVPITADDLTRHGLRDPYRKLMEAIDLLPSPSIDIRLDLLPPNARTTELASYADTLTEALRDSEEFRRLWTLMLDSPSDFIQVWRIFLNTDDPRRHYVLNLSGNLVQQCCLEESKTAGLRHVWEGLIQGGLCDLFPTVFYRVHSPSSLRSVILIGRGVLDWARRSSSSAKHRVIMPRFLRQLNELWKVIWAHELMLRDDSPFDKVVHARDCAPSCLRESLQLMVFAYLPQIENEEMRGDWVSDRDSCKALCRIVLLLWHSAPGEKATSAQKHYLFNILGQLFDPKSVFTCFNQQDRDVFTDEDIVAKLGAGRFLSQLVNLLKDPPLEGEADLVGNTLPSIMSVVGHTIGRPAFKPHFVSSGILRAIRDFADIPRSHQLVANPDGLWNHHDQVLQVFVILLRDTPISQAAKPLIRDCDILGLLAQASMHFANAPMAKPGHSTITNILSVYVVIAGGVQAQVGREQLHELLLQSVRPEWYRIIHDLRRRSKRDPQVAKKCEKLLSIWKKLGDTLDLVEDTERKEYERDMKRTAQLCGWSECQYSKVPSGSPTRACAGCGEVRYCSRSCQQNDWKQGGHKKRCKRLKAELHMSRK